MTKVFELNSADNILVNGGLHRGDDLIINGCFDVAQRGTTQSTAGYASIDRWRVSAIGGTYTQSREPFNVGDTLGSSVKPFYSRQAVSGQTLSNHYATRIQSIEDVRSYAGQTITVLGWARRVSGAGNIALDLSQDFGTGGSPSGIIAGIGAQQITLSSLWTPFAAVVNVPSIAGKTLGTNGNSNLSMVFWASAGADFNARTSNLGLQNIAVDLFGIHIRKGVVPVEAANYYSPPPIWQNELACKRYFQRYVDPPLRGAVGAGSTVSRAGMILPVSMRATPINSFAGTLSFFDGLASANYTSTTMQYLSPTQVEFDIVISSALTSGRAACLYIGGGGTMSLDAEL